MTVSLRGDISRGSLLFKKMVHINHQCYDNAMPTNKRKRIQAPGSSLYFGQNHSKYMDCLPLAIANACRFYGVSCPIPGTDDWEKVVDITGCRHGGAIMRAEDIADYFGLRAIPINRRKIVTTVPVLLSVWNPDTGSSLHATLVVGWDGDIGTALNYRSSGPVIEKTPLLLGKEPPTNADGSYNRSVKWRSMYVPMPYRRNGQAYNILKK